MLLDRLEGKKFDLISKDLVETLTFKDNHVSATLGVKNGPLTAPVLQCTVTSDNSLIIKGLFPIIWNNIEFGEGIITVQRNGEYAEYKILNTP